MRPFCCRREKVIWSLLVLVDPRTITYTRYEYIISIYYIHIVVVVLTLTL